jgi:hypothetical protein
MPHQNTDSTKAAAQNAATGYDQTNQQAEGQRADERPEPRAYAAPNVEDSTLAPPASGEVSDYMDEGDPSFGAQQGANHTNWELHGHKLRADQQGPKTRAANKAMNSGHSGSGGGGGR